MGGNWGSLLLRGSLNAELYGPLQEEWLKGKEKGSDQWFHKNRYEFVLSLSRHEDEIFIGWVAYGDLGQLWICI